MAHRWPLHLCEWRQHLMQKMARRCLGQNRRKQRREILLIHSSPRACLLKSVGCVQDVRACDLVAVVSCNPSQR